MTPREALRDFVLGMAISLSIIGVLVLIAFLVRVPQGEKPEQDDNTRGKVPFCSTRTGCFA